MQQADDEDCETDYKYRDRLRGQAEKAGHTRNANQIRGIEFCSGPRLFSFSLIDLFNRPIPDMPTDKGSHRN